MPGELHNVNTYERFKQLITHERRTELAQTAADRIWADICSGAAEANPALLSRFLLLSFADLKLVRYFYWSAACGMTLLCGAPLQVSHALNVCCG